MDKWGIMEMGGAWGSLIRSQHFVNEPIALRSSEDSQLGGAWSRAVSHLGLWDTSSLDPWCPRDWMHSSALAESEVSVQRQTQVQIPFHSLGSVLALPRSSCAPSAADSVPGLWGGSLQRHSCKPSHGSTAWLPSPCPFSLGQCLVNSHWHPWLPRSMPSTQASWYPACSVLEVCEQGGPQACPPPAAAQHFCDKEWSSSPPQQQQQPGSLDGASWRTGWGGVGRGRACHEAAQQAAERGP